MEFVKLQAINDNFGKPKWQACDNVSIMAVGPVNEWKSPQGKVYYYYPVSVMTEAGVAVEAQLAKEDSSPVNTGDMAVECQIKWEKGKLKYQFRPARTQQNPAEYNRPNQQSAPQQQSFQQSEYAKDDHPEKIKRIQRGNAVNACAALSKDPATFWSLLPLVVQYLETGEMPSE